MLTAKAAFKKQSPVLYGQLKPLVSHLPDTRAALRRGYIDEGSWDPWEEVFAEYTAMREGIASGSRAEWLPLLRNTSLYQHVSNLALQPQNADLVDAARTFATFCPILTYSELGLGNYSFRRYVIQSGATEPFAISLTLPPNLQLQLELNLECLKLVCSVPILRCVHLPALAGVLSYHDLRDRIPLRSQEELEVLCVLIEYLDSLDGSQNSWRDSILIAAVTDTLTHSKLIATETLRTLALRDRSGCGYIANCIMLGEQLNYEMEIRKVDMQRIGVGKMILSAALQVQNWEVAELCLDQLHADEATRMILNHLTRPVYDFLMRIRFSWSVYSIIRSAYKLDTFKQLLEWFPPDMRSRVIQAAGNTVPCKMADVQQVAYYSYMKSLGANMEQLSQNAWFQFWCQPRKCAQLLEAGVKVDLQALPKGAYEDALLSNLYSGNEAAALASSILWKSVPETLIKKVEELATDDQLSQLDAADVFVALTSVVCATREKAIELFRKHQNVMARTTVTIALRRCSTNSLKYLHSEGMDIGNLGEEKTFNLKLGRTTVHFPRNIITHTLQTVDPSRVDVYSCHETLLWLTELPMEHEEAGTLLFVIRAMGKRSYSRIYTALRSLFDTLVARVNVHVVYGEFSLLGYLAHQRARRKQFTAAEKLRAAELLLSAGADINQMLSGISPLMWAATVPSEGMLELLLSRGADRSICTEEGRTAMYYAAGKNENIKILKSI